MARPRTPSGAPSALLLAILLLAAALGGCGEDSTESAADRATRPPETATTVVATSEAEAADPASTQGAGVTPAAAPTSAFGPTSAETDREALIALYNATDGENWTRNSNWLSDAPLGEWEDVSTDVDGRVTRLDIPTNELSGCVPGALRSRSDPGDLPFC